MQRWHQPGPGEEEELGELPRVLSEVVQWPDGAEAILHSSSSLRPMAFVLLGMTPSNYQSAWGLCRVVVPNPCFV